MSDEQQSGWRWLDGSVKFYNSQKKFGFIRPVDGTGDVFLHESVLPGGAPAPRPRAKCRYVLEVGRRGPYAKAVEFVESAPR